MHLGPLLLLMAGAAAVGVVHSVLPDHWVPLAVVASTERWSPRRRDRSGRPPVPKADRDAAGPHRRRRTDHYWRWFSRLGLNRPRASARPRFRRRARATRRARRARRARQPT